MAGAIGKSDALEPGQPLPGVPRVRAPDSSMGYRQLIPVALEPRTLALQVVK